MIIFESIDIEGFGSIIGPYRYILNKGGVNLIMGENGVGKTTIFSGLTWAIYGELLKKKSSAKPWPAIIPPDFKGTMVGVNFMDDSTNKKYRVVRCLDYQGVIQGSKGKDRLILIEDGEEVKGLRNKSHVQATIINIMGYSFNLFKNSILFGQKLTRIINESGPEKKKVFDEAFEVSFINFAKKNTEKDRDKLKDEYTALRPKIALYEEKLKGLNQRLGREQELHKNWERDLKSKKVDLIKEITDYEDKAVKAKKSKKILNKLRDEENLIKSRLLSLNSNLAIVKASSDNKFKLELEVEQLLGEVEDLKNSYSDLKIKATKIQTHCPRCKQALAKKLVKAESLNILKEAENVKLKIKPLKVKIKCLKKEVEEHNQLITSNESYIKEELTLKNELELLENKIKKHESNLNNLSIYIDMINKLKGELKALDNEKPDFQKNQEKLGKEIKTLEEKLNPLSKQCNSLKKEIDILDWLINDPLSNRGIKAYIFENMVKLVNDNLRTYFEILGYEICFYVDMESAHKNFELKIIKDGLEIFYEELSGGQQQLVDIAIAFSIHDTVAVNKACNILIMDEVFESLSSSNIELVGELIKLKAQNLSVHLITHREEFRVRNSKGILLTLEGKGITKFNN